MSFYDVVYQRNNNQSQQGGHDGTGYQRYGQTLKNGVKQDDGSANHNRSGSQQNGRCPHRTGIDDGLFYRNSVIQPDFDKVN